jgi:hypothetical protein
LFVLVTGPSSAIGASTRPPSTTPTALAASAARKISPYAIGSVPRMM